MATVATPRAGAATVQCVNPLATSSARGASCHASPTRKAFRDETAASEVFGNFLMMAASVFLASVFAGVLLSIPRPLDESHVDLALGITNPDGVWATADEAIHLEHLGGEALHADEVTLVLRLPTGDEAWPGPLLGGAFDDGRLRIGERWVHALTLSEGDVLELQIVVRVGDGSHVAFSDRAVAEG